MGDYGHHQSLTQGSGVVPCSDMCGTIVETKSDQWEKGARVVSTFMQSHLTGKPKRSDVASGLGFPLAGVLAEYRVFDADGLVKVPEYLTEEEASCLPIAAVTAWMSINGFHPIGEYVDYSANSNSNSNSNNSAGAAAAADDDHVPTVLVQGTGGVAISGLQIAHAAGLKTIVTSSSDDKLARATKDLGAGTAINYRTHWAWQDAVLKATDDNGADYIFETGGARTLHKSFDCVAFGGIIACIGYLSGKQEEKEPALEQRLSVNVLALRKNATLQGILVGPRDRFEEMLGFYEKKEIRPVICKVFKFEEAVNALKFLKNGEHFGKVVIKVSDR